MSAASYQAHPHAPTGRRNAAQRQRADDLKGYRERLTSGSDIKPEFEYELLSMFARNEIGAPLAMPALCFIFYIASMYWATIAEATCWIAIVFASKSFLQKLCRDFLELPRAEANIKLWRRRFVLAEFVNGVALAGFALIGMGQTPAHATDVVISSPVFIFATLMVVLAIRMTFASPIMAVLYAGTVPLTLAVVARLVSLNDPFYFALASLAVGIHIYFIYLAGGLHATALAMIEYRTEKDGLIAELEEASAISDEARRRAEAANQAKSRFLATMSHELRTPLNAIMGFSEVMKDEHMGPVGNPIYKDYAGNIHDSGSHLLQLINEILDLSRIEAGRYELHEESLRLAEIAIDCHRLMKLRADQKGIQIIEDIDDGLAHIWADPRALRQICLNLMSNALKFTPRGGRVTLTVAALDGGGQVLSVKDTGPGIPAEEIPKVLQTFGQGSLAHQSAEGGTGLGLPIVKSLIELHGGAFVLQSELRRGTEARVELPKFRVLQQVAPLQPLGHERHRAAASVETTAKPKTGRPARLRPGRSATA